jgi:hypothetical protein
MRMSPVADIIHAFGGDDTISLDDQLDEGDVFLTNIDIPVLEPGETEVLRLNVKGSMNAGVFRRRRPPCRS